MVRFQRPRKTAVLLYLDDVRQANYDKEKWCDRPDTVGNELGNDERCLFCGAPPGKQCMKADATFRNYPHQKRRDLARAKGKS